MLLIGPGGWIPAGTAHGVSLIARPDSPHKSRVGGQMKKSLAIAATATALLAVTPSAAQAARPGWSTSGLTGVWATGQYSKTGNSVHIYGKLYDTAGDDRAARIIVRFSGECCAHAITNSKGNGTSVPVDLSSTQAAHLDIKECKGGGIHLWTCADFIRVY